MTKKLNLTWIIGALFLFGAIGVLGSADAGAVGSEESQSHYRQAQDYIEQDDYRAALIELRNALKADSNNVEARLLLADVYLRFGQGIAAQTELEAARQRGADRTLTAVSMARAYLVQGRFEEALAEIENIDIPGSDVMDARLILGDVYFAQKEIALARESFESAEAAAPNHYLPKMALSRVAMADGDLELARRKADEAIALAPAESNVYLTKGLVARTEGNQEEAIGYLTSAIDFAPQNLAALIERAATYLDLQREEEAQLDLDAVYSMVPEHPMAHYLSAVLLARQQDFEAAYGKLEDAGAAIDNFLPGVLLKGIVAYQIGNLEQASMQLSRFVDELPDNIAARRAYGSTLLRLRNPAAAVSILLPLLDLGDEDPRVYALIGSAYMQMGEYETAQGYLEESVTRAPDAKGVRTQLALGRFVLGDKETAISDLEGILEGDPQQLRAAIMLSLIERREGNFDKSISWADQVIEIIPESPIGYNIRGAVHIADKNLEAARQDFGSALEIDDGFHLARSNLAQLERMEDNNDEARRLFQLVLNQDRNNTRALVALTEMAIQSENFVEAVDWAERAVNIAPAVPAYHLMLVQSHIAARNLPRALIVALDADQAFPNEPTAARMLGKVQFATEDFDGAVSAFSRWARMVPDDIDARLHLARAEWRAGMITDARLTFSRALGMAGSENKTLLADAANFEIAQKNYDAALGYALELSKAHPDTKISNMLFGKLYLESGRYPEAIDAYLRAVEEDDTDITRRALAQAYFASGNGDDAISVLEEWLEGHPDSSDVVNLLSVISIQLGRWEVAARQLEKLVNVGNPDPDFLNNLAYVYHLMDDDRAVATAQRAYDLRSGDADINDTLGWILVDSDQDIRRGLLLLENADRIRGDDAAILYHLGVAQNKNGRGTDAHDTLRRALDIGGFSGEADARELLASLGDG